MIRSNELRIGNLFNWGVNTVPIRSIHTESFLKDKVSVYIELNEKLPNHCLYITEIEPIPLTEEWLLKFGFEKELDKSMVKGDIAIFLDRRFKINLFLKDNQENKWFSFNSKVEYVHQVQNLYFALTGEELTLNPKID